MTGTLHRALLNRYALGTALALVIAPLAGIGQAQAAPGCSPASGHDGAVVTCSTDTTNQDGTTGYGQGTERNVTLTVNGSPTPNGGVKVKGDDTGINLGQNSIITIQSNASVTGTAQVGVSVLDGSTITNAGTISGGSFGIQDVGGTPNDLTVHNSGTISAGIAILELGGITLDNSNSITGTSGAAIISHREVTVTSNTGTISGVGFGISAPNATVTNDLNGVIEATGANGIGLGGFNTGFSTAVTLDNGGTVQALGSGGIAVQGLTVNVNSNTGTISGDAFGINATGTATVKNGSGTISAAAANGVAIGDIDHGHGFTNTVTLDNAGTVQALGAGGIAVQGQTVNVNSNTGDIVGDAMAIAAIGSTATATVTNAKNITALGVGHLNDGIAILAQNAIVNNLASGVITGGSNGGSGISASTVNLNNAGAISGGIAVFANNSATVNNTGSITASDSSARSEIGLGTGSLLLTNSGTIAGGSAILNDQDANIVNLAGGTITGTFIGIGTGTLTLVNSGMISGATAIKATGAATITNFGTIQSTAGATGTAIQLSGAADTLNIKKGSSIIGLIDMGGGADVINIDGTASSSMPRGVSVLARAASTVADALLKQLENFKGVINFTGGGGIAGPTSVQQTVAADGRTITTGGGSASTSGQPSVTVNGNVASLDPTALAQQDRTLMDFTGGMSSMVQDRLRGAASGTGGPTSMSYALEDAHAQMFNKALAPASTSMVTVWSSMFGAARNQGGTDTTLNSTSSVFGGVIGVDRRITPDWLVGLFAGGGSGSLNVDLASQKIDTDYFSVGGYSRFEWASQFFDATLQGGSLNNRSSRLVMNNITNGMEHATASYNGWFISPELAYGYRLNWGNGLVVTPTVRVRYVAGSLDGYSELGSAQTLSVGSRTLQDFEERGEIEVSKTGFFDDPNLKGTMHGGVIALQRVGDTTVNAVLIGQSLSFITPGKNSAVGGVAGFGLDYHLTSNVTLYGAAEGMIMSDQSRVGSAKGGLRVGF